MKRLCTSLAALTVTVAIAAVVWIIYRELEPQDWSLL